MVPPSAGVLAGGFLALGVMLNGNNDWGLSPIFLCQSSSYGSWKMILSITIGFRVFWGQDRILISHIKSMYIINFRCHGFIERIIRLICLQMMKLILQWFKNLVYSEIHVRGYYGHERMFLLRCGFFSELQCAWIAQFMVVLNGCSTNFPGRS